MLIGVNLNRLGDTLNMLQSPYEEFQEKLSHRGYDHYILVSTGLAAVLGQTIAHIVIQMIKFLSTVKANDNDILCRFLCEPQLHQ